MGLWYPTPTHFLFCPLKTHWPLHNQCIFKDKGTRKRMKGKSKTSTSVYTLAGEAIVYTAAEKMAHNLAQRACWFLFSAKLSGKNSFLEQAPACKCNKSILDLCIINELWRIYIYIYHHTRLWYHHYSIQYQQILMLCKFYIHITINFTWISGLKYLIIALSARYLMGWLPWNFLSISMVPRGWTLSLFNTPFSFF